MLRSLKSGHERKHSETGKLPRKHTLFLFHQDSNVLDDSRYSNWSVATKQHTDLLCYVFSTFVSMGKKGGVPKLFYSIKKYVKNQSYWTNNESSIWYNGRNFKNGSLENLCKIIKMLSVSSHFKESDIPYYRHNYINVSFSGEFRHLSSHFVLDEESQIDRLELLKSTFYELVTEFFKCSELAMYQNLAIRQLSLRDQIKLLKMAKSLDLTRGSLMLATCLYCAKKYTAVIK